MRMRVPKLPTRPVCAPEAVITGDKYRLSLLTERLIRLEYAEDGVFEDRASQRVLCREFPAVPFRTEEKNGVLHIYTRYLHVIYDQKQFSSSGLSIAVLASPPGCPAWRYGKPSKDLKGTCRTLDGADGETELESGLLSAEGYAVLDDSDSMLLTEDGRVMPRKQNRTDLYFFGYGFDYRQCIRDFYWLCGKPPLLPRYALGNWWSRFHRYSAESYRALMERFEAEDLPFSVAVLDMDWHWVDIDPKWGTGWTGYSWNTDLFPDPKAFLQGLHDRGMKVILNEHPADGIRAFETSYPALANAMGIDPATEQTVAFQADDPEFLAAFYRHVHHPLEEDGVDAWWIDWQQGGSSGTQGLDPLWVLNHYGYLDSQRRGRRGLILSRYAGVGSHRYPLGFSGDTCMSWQSLAFQPYFTATASNVGFGWWSHDIGGHMLGKRDDELTARWVQFGVFSPVMRLHSSANPFMHKEPWELERNARASVERFLRLRHAMLPYLYTMNYLASREGQPLLMPMYWHEPKNWCLYEKRLRNEYYFGTELIVAPITEPMNPVTGLGKTTAWLPDGRWFDFFSGLCYTGGRMLNLYRSLEEMPVLVRAGGIVPLQKKPERLNDVSNPAGFEVHVFPGATGTFTIWEDEDQAEDADENWVQTKLELQEDRFLIHPAAGNLAAIPARRSYCLRFRSVKPCEVTLSGTEAESRYDKTTQTLTVELAQTDVQKEITVQFSAPLCPAENPVLEQTQKILERAKTDLTEKRSVYEQIKTHGAAAIGSIMACVEDEALRDALIEVLTAQTES